MWRFNGRIFSDVVVLCFLQKGEKNLPKTDDVMLQRFYWGLFLLLCMGTGCIKRPKKAVSLPERNYNLDLKAIFQKIDDPGQDHVMHLNSKLSVIPLKRHRDDSVFLRISVSKADGTLNGTDVDIGLEGKWIVARVLS